jgi:hypothetical protein
MPSVDSIANVVEWQLIVRKALTLKQLLSEKLLADTEVAPNIIDILPLARL